MATAADLKKDPVYLKRLMAWYGYKGDPAAALDAHMAASAKYPLFATLHPFAQPLHQKLHDALVVETAKHAGYKLTVVSTLRTYAEQNALYAQGRTKPGNIVTKAPGGRSNHNFGAASDHAILSAKGWISDMKLWDSIFEPAASQVPGLEWGKHWKFVDRPHLQVRGIPGSAQVQRDFESGMACPYFPSWKPAVPVAAHVVVEPTEDDWKTLRMGDTGDDVKSIQAIVGATPDGNWGPGTDAKVKAWQTANKLTPDGAVGPKTAALMGLT